MKKRLVALVLCLVMVLGCTVVRGEDDSTFFEGLLLSMFDFSEGTCRNSSMNRSALAAIAYLDYSTSVDNAYEADFSKPFYVGFSDDIGFVQFFSENGHSILLLTSGSLVFYNHDTYSPSTAKIGLTSSCEWVYEASLSEMAEVFRTISESLN